jgi:acetolactate synthase-1/2/3 large subunit
VTDPKELAGALAQAKKNAGTTLIEVLCDENAFPPITFYTPDAAVIK